MAIAVFELDKCVGSNAGTEVDCSKHPTFLGESYPGAADGNIHTLVTSSYPVRVPPEPASPPTANAQYSYEVWLRWKCTGAPTTACQNFKFWTSSTDKPDGPTPGACTIYAGIASAAATPVKTKSSIATVSVHDHYIDVGSALAVPVVPGDSVINAVNEQTKWLVLQLEVLFGALPGDITTQLFMLGYEES